MKVFKKVLSVVISLVLTVMMCIPCLVVTAETVPTVVTLYHTNDMHGAVENLSYVKTIYQTTENAILVDCGDATQGSSLATYTKGASIIELMNDVGYDGMVLGNHEFDYGSDITLSNAKIANFPVVSANVLNSEKQSLLADEDSNGEYFIVETAGYKFGFFGLTSVETAYKTNPQKLNGVTFLDEIATAEAMVTALEGEGVDFIIGLTHVGIDESTIVTSHIIADTVEGIDLIVDGHSHSEDKYVSEATGTVVAQTGTKLANLGRVRFTIDGDKVDIEPQLITQEEYMLSAPDEEYTKKYADMNEELKPILNEVVAYSETPIFTFADGSTRVTRMEETPAGSLVADAMKYAGEEMLKAMNVDYPVIALQNGGGVRADLPEGNLTVGDILNVLPFNNTIQVTKITPAQLYRVLENGVSGLVYDAETGYQTNAYAALCVTSGLEIYADLSKQPQVVENGKIVTEGQRIVSVYLRNDDGSKTLLNIDDNTTTLALVSNDFEISGGDNYVTLAELEHIVDGGPLDEALQDYVKVIADENGKFTYAATDGRLNFIQQEYSSKVAVTLDIELEPTKEYEVSVDGGEYFTATTDENGHIVLSDIDFGAHTIGIKTEKKVELDYKPADVDGDNEVLMKDVTEIQREIADLVKFDEAQMKAADVDGDGKVTMQDVVLVQRYIAELESEFPCENVYETSTDYYFTSTVTGIHVADYEILGS